MDLRSAAGHIEHRRGVFVVARGGRQNHCAGKRPLADRILMDTFQGQIQPVKWAIDFAKR